MADDQIAGRVGRRVQRRRLVGDHEDRRRDRRLGEREERACAGSGRLHDDGERHHSGGRRQLEHRFGIRDVDDANRAAGKPEDRHRLLRIGRQQQLVVVGVVRVPVGQAHGVEQAEVGGSAERLELHGVRPLEQQAVRNRERRHALIAAEEGHVADDGAVDPNPDLVAHGIGCIGDALEDHLERGARRRRRVRVPYGDGDVDRRGIGDQLAEPVLGVAVAQRGKVDAAILPLHCPQEPGRRRRPRARDRRCLHAEPCAGASGQEIHGGVGRGRVDAVP